MGFARQRRRVILAICAIAAVAGAATQLPVTASGPPPAVEGGIDQAYTAGSRVPGGPLVPSVDAFYDGDPIRVAARSVGRRALEPTIGVDSDGGAYFAASWHDDSASMVLPVTRVMRSLDGGSSWESVSPEIPVTGEPSPPVNADPYVYVDPDTDRLFNPEAAGACLYTNISDDKGETWTTNPLVCGNVNVDHQSFGGGPFPPALAPLKTVYPNVLYYCSNRVASSSCNRSVDGGLVWTGTALPAFPGYDVAAGGLCGGLAGHLGTDRAGRLFLPKGHCGTPWLATSEDGGDTWIRTQVSTIPAASTHIAMAADDANNVYVLWWDSELRLPWLAVSKDHGRTFGPAMMVAPPGVKEVNFPEIEAGEAGKLAIVFPGTTSGNRTDAKRPWNYYTVVTTNAADAKPLFVSTTANSAADPVHRGNCGPGRCGAMWDFIQVVTSPLDGGFWATLSDTCESANCRKTNGSIDGESSGMGVAVRQLSGPRIRAPKPPFPTPTTTAPAPTTTSTAGPR